MNDLAIVVPYFNFTGLKRREELLKQCVSALALESDDIYIMECKSPEEYPSHLDTLGMDASIWTIDGEMMFQKERLLQLAFGRLISMGYTKVLHVDADNIFLKSGWQDVISEILNHYNAIQCFETCKTHYTGHYSNSPSMMSTRDVTNGVPGGPWAYSLPFLSQTGYFSLCPVGTGDFINLLSFLPHAGIDKYCAYWGPSFRQHISKWLINRRGFEKTATFAPLDVVSMNHGTFEARQYKTRHTAQYNFDPATDLALHGDSGYFWSGNNPALEEHVRNYMKSKDA